MNQAIYIRAGIITVLSVLFSVFVTMVVLHLFHGKFEPLALITAAILPLLIAFPTSVWMGMQGRALEIANQQLLDNCQELVKLHQHAELQARLDPMTGLFNRNHFLDTAKKTTEHNGTGALVMIDVDHFKSINDRFGHAAGDEALMLIVAALRNLLHPSDFFGRLGGEEFAVFLGRADEKTTLQTTKKMIRTVQQIEFKPLDQQRVRLTISIGSAMRSQFSDFESLIRMADSRMYRAKSLGRNRVVADGDYGFEGRSKISSDAA